MKSSVIIPSIIAGLTALGCETPSSPPAPATSASVAPAASSAPPVADAAPEAAPADATTSDVVTKAASTDASK